MAVLEIRDLHVQREGKEILKGVNLKTGPGEVHAIMGPNGSGKSTLSYTLLAHPKYEVTSGDILLDGESILELTADERAKKSGTKNKRKGTRTTRNVYRFWCSRFRGSSEGIRSRWRRN